MPSVARFQDYCSGHGGYPPRKNNEASSNVFVNYRGWHRQSDGYQYHCNDNDCHTAQLKTGSSTVYVNDLQAGRLSDPLSCGSAVIQGSTTVYCGG